MDTILPWLIHENNLDGKIMNDYKGRIRDFIRFKEEKYAPFKHLQMNITGITENDISTKARLLDRYLKDIDEFNRDGWITPQSKFRPTALEEFCGYLFKDLSKVRELGLNFSMKGIYAGIRIHGEGNPTFETKDVDFCISKGSEATLSGITYNIEIPIVAIECKTYVDKTMFNEAQFTAQKLKGAAPRVKVFMIVETNEIKLSEIPSQTPIDQIFVLRENRESSIDGDTVWEFFREVKDTLDSMGAQLDIQLPGKLIVK